VLRLNDNIDSGDSAGQRFRASLEGGLLDTSGKMAVAVGTKVLGLIVESKQSGRLAGKPELELAFTDLEINGMLIPIQSQGVQAVGESAGRDTGRKVAAGALVGAAFGGGKGAAKGAAIGGAAALLTRGQQIKIPSGTMLELKLVGPVKVPSPEPALPATPAAAAVAPAPAPAPSAAPAPAPAAAPAAAAAAGTPPSPDQKACVKKLMANGFTADEALASCNKPK
jgi:hypothetical protein